MVDFRRVILALAVLTLFAGLASAQQENCSAQATVSTPLRAEGYTEQTGDIIVNCVNGNALAVGANIPLVNITVFYNTTVTSRLLGSALPSGQTPSEALLLIDEPNTGVGGTIGTGIGQVSYGSTLPLIPCLTPATGCAQTVGASNTGFSTAVVGTSPAPNVYQGVTNGNSVTFYGVPVLPPSTVGSRVYRITNVRVNATTGGAAQGTTPVQGYITVSGSAALPISNSQPIVGYIQKGLSGSVKNAVNFNQCSSQKVASTGTLVFQELFGTAFKTRVAAQTATAGAGQLGILPAAPNPFNQSTPGGIYNSESNFVYAGAYGNAGYTVGLADFGTRLKATFTNIPSGVHIFVSTANVGANAAAQAAPGGNLGNATGSSTYVGLAQLVNGETTSDGAGILPALSTDVTGTASAEVTIVNNTGTAVWEVVNTNPNTAEGFTFNVFLTYTAATATNTPLPSVPGSLPSVTLSYAPTATSGAASATLPISRFSAVTAATGTSFTVNICRTILLYPFLTHQAGFDTGVTVANTTVDPFGTSPQQGNCKLNWYGGTTAALTVPPPPSDTGVIVPGTVWAHTLSEPGIAPTFQGYMIAVCNFQFAHGFAFISDVGARNLAMGYLAIVLNDPGVNARATAATGVPGSTGPEVGGH